MLIRELDCRVTDWSCDFVRLIHVDSDIVVPQPCTVVREFRVDIWGRPRVPAPATYGPFKQEGDSR